MIFEKIVVGPFQCNCMVFACPETKEALVIDPGHDEDKIQGCLESLGVIPKLLVHTHGHLDHIGATRSLKLKYPDAQILIHQGDQWLYENLKMQGGLFGFHYEDPLPVDLYLQDGMVLQAGSVSFEVRHSPGHSPGSVCLCCEKSSAHGERPLVLTGDTLFRDSVGRTDLWGGNFATMKSSIETKIFSLPSDTVVLPGHGPMTSIDYERKHNEFL